MKLPHALIPAKTFLFGEYAILDNAPAVVLATPPFFEVVHEGYTKFHKNSIAAKMLYSNQRLGIRSDFSFKGIGRSSAEVLVAYVDSNSDIEITSLMKQYKSHCELSGINASGADILCQWNGGCLQYSQNSYESKQWPFKGYDIGIWSTGNQLATSAHLQEFRNVPDGLIVSANACWSAWRQNDINNLCSMLNEFQAELVAGNLQDPATTKLVEKISSIEAVDAAKGCGAMGTDTVLTISKSSSRDDLIEQSDSLKINNIFLNNFTTSGLKNQMPHFKNSIELELYDKSRSK